MKTCANCGKPMVGKWAWTHKFCPVCEEQMQRKIQQVTNCEDCTGWYNSCAPDDFPEYIADPKHCAHFERKKVQK